MQRSVPLQTRYMHKPFPSPQMFSSERSEGPNPRIWRHPWCTCFGNSGLSLHSHLPIRTHNRGHTSAPCHAGGVCSTARGPWMSVNELSLSLALGEQRIKGWNSFRHSEKNAFLLSFFICFMISTVALILICLHTNCRFSTLMDPEPHLATAKWLCMTHLGQRLAFSSVCKPGRPSPQGLHPGRG